MGAAKQFREPDPEDKQRAKALAAGLRLPPAFESLNASSTAELLSLAKSVSKNAEALLTFVDSSRDLARKAAVETIAIEMSVILAGDRLDMVIDALERATINSRPAQISLEGLRTLRRAEALMAEASSNMARFAQDGRSTLGDQAARESDETRRREALIQIEERRLILVREEHRLSEEAMDRELDRKRSEVELVGSLAGPYVASPMVPPSVAPVTPKPVMQNGPAVLAAAAEVERGGESILWTVLAIGALTFSAGIVIALLLRPAYVEPQVSTPRPRRR